MGTQQILKNASSAAKINDISMLEKALEEISALHNPGAEEHYVRAKILFWLGRNITAEEAFREALELDPNHASSLYSLGLLLAEEEQNDEAQELWERALPLAPTHIDLRYNAGQLHYSKGNFSQALVLWDQAHLLDPSDLGILKKKIQALNALEKYQEAQDLINEYHLNSKEQELVIDQLKIKEYDIFVFESLKKPDPNKIDYPIIFKVIKDNIVVMTAQLESSPYGREQGFPYAFGVFTAVEHKLLGPMYEQRPDYSVIKKRAIEVITKILEDGLP